jgi:hypothetical protein
MLFYVYNRPANWIKKHKISLGPGNLYSTLLQMITLFMVFDFRVFDVMYNHNMPRCKTHTLFKLGLYQFYHLDVTQFFPEEYI